MTNDELLKELITHAERILIKLQPVVIIYWQTLEGLTTCDVSSDNEYRTNFTRFYRLRLPRTDCYDHYFDLLERSKDNPDLSFAEVLADLQIKTGRIEASFASKLVATVNPCRPVIDRIVLASMGYRLPYYYELNRMEKVVELYNRLSNRLESMQQDVRFDTLKRRFTSVFPDYRFTDLKILDLMIWQLERATRVVV